MNPAPSVILFTTLSGAGYGMVAIAGLTWPALAAAGATLPMIVMGLAIVLIVTGLLSSVFHLGRPERAWRALSQWRTSWLSREGVAAIVGFAPIAGFAVSWSWPTLGIGATWAWGLAAALASIATLFTTAMIYRSLTPIGEWNHPLVVPGYMVLGPMTGALIVNAIAEAHGIHASPILAGGLALLAAGGVVKTLYWTAIDALPEGSTAAAIGIPNASARSLEWPHTEANYLLKEMGFAIARRHAARLRRIAATTGWFAPFVLVVLQSQIPDMAAAAIAALAALSALIGVAVERWLFFAQARHTVTLYYGR